MYRYCHIYYDSEFCHTTPEDMYIWIQNSVNDKLIILNK
jgi:hypothetical protein